MVTKLADFTTSIYAVWWHVAMFTIIIIVGIANHNPANACSIVSQDPPEIKVDIYPNYPLTLLPD